MKRPVLIWLIVTLVCLTGLAQRTATWPQDSARYRAYVSQSNKLGTAKRDSALVYATKALQLAQLHGQKKVEADSYSQIGALSAAYSTRVDNYLEFNIEVQLA